MFGDYDLSLHDYLSILRRRALVMILVFGSVLTAAVVFAMLQPRVYESTATILVEGPQVQVAAGDRANQPRPEDRVRLIQQRLMTRESLISIADRHELFVSEGERELSDTKVATAMRASIRLNVMGAENPWGPRPAAISFSVSFQGESPEKAYAVTRELAELFLSSNQQDRMDQATRTTGFLSAEADRVRQELEALEARIAAFKSQQAGSLPDNLAMSLGGLQSMEAELRIAERDHRLAVSELRALEVDLAAARRGVTAPGVVADPGPSEAEQELERARTELAGLRAIYSESHPDVRSLIRRIQGLEQAVATEPRAQTPARTAAREQAGLAVSRLEAQVEAARNRVDLFAAQQSSLRASIGQLRAQATRGPQLERQLAALQREQEAAQTKYNELRSQLSSAQLVENLEGGQQVERFTLLEPPVMPEYPVEATRRKIAAAGFVVAVGAALGAALLLELLFARVWGLNALVAAVNQRPLAVIPYISTQSEIQAVEQWRKRAVWIALVAILLVLLAVHLWVMPLQNVLKSVSSRPD
ncbi:MAG TPA: Wzz/FepE/Etk N-terminal domain-containing protein [Hydrogenophaga sp.]|uniref:GumC family protein n=1 Tax=Hydrogenophaga sp. TaxID=1904254 RepID=UPI002B8FE18C|nr:Wzz/FepE/Etk N-terminal domain-containing protein [Hydrogenophaga sp.]HMN91996.1 Wzz/FepE/Etk N-terminal domain-containing protein [Hydrogenophaga sp.]HMP08798.1 Wzz/FepE/Etk N-terminal domain-containing protein [Hydrogenophaga sp.]